MCFLKAHYRRMHLLSHCALLTVFMCYIAPAELCSDCQNGTEPSGRRKRIVYGTPLRDINSYDVVGYFVHISLASGWSWLWYHSTNFFPLDLLEVSRHPKAGAQLCGGSLITETIVQTACHCLTNEWSKTPNWEPLYHFPILKNGWEDLLILHHGYTKVDDFKDGVWSKKFVVHLECKVVNASGDPSHDFGLILTDKLLVAVPWMKMNFAPVYTQTELAMQYYNTMKREAICLMVGFGKWYFKNKYAGVFGESSTELMHGWRAVTNYWECFEYRLSMVANNYLYGIVSKDVFKMYDDNYVKDCSWVCTTFFGRQRGINARGDSGSPVTCAGEYFGVTSTLRGMLWSTTNRSIETTAALAYTMADNAVEYRVAMLARLAEFVHNHNDYPPEVRDPATVNPFNPNAYYTIRPRKFYVAYSHSKNVHGACFTSIAALPIVVLFHFIIN